MEQETNLLVWGSGYKGQLGLGNENIFLYKPVRVKGNQIFTELSINRTHSLALDEKGKMWVWGDNTFGQLGTGDTKERNIPTEIMKDCAFTQISAGPKHSLALDKDGNIWSCGAGSNHSSSHPIQTKPYLLRKNKKIIQISAGTFHSLAIDDSGYLWMWGRVLDNHGFLVKKENDIYENIFDCNTFTQISTGSFHSLALDEKGKCWILSYDNINFCPVITQLKGNHTFTQVTAGHDHFIGLDIHGKLWVWGKNDSGQLGTGSYISESEPVMIMKDYRFKKITAGYFTSMAMDINNNLWFWGCNDGNLFDLEHVSTYQYEPIMVFTNIPNIKKFDIYSDHGVIITNLDKEDNKIEQKEDYILYKSRISSYTDEIESLGQKLIDMRIHLHELKLKSVERQKEMESQIQKIVGNDIEIPHKFISKLSDKELDAEISDIIKIIGKIREDIEQKCILIQKEANTIFHNILTS